MYVQLDSKRSCEKGGSPESFQANALAARPGNWKNEPRDGPGHAAAWTVRNKLAAFRDLLSIETKWFVVSCSRSTNVDRHDVSVVKLVHVSCTMGMSNRG